MTAPARALAPLALLLAWGALLGAAYEWGGPAARGVGELKKKENAAALRSLAEGARDLPRSAAVPFDRALAFQRLGFADSARASYDTALRLHGREARAAAAYNLGNEALRKGKISEAIERYKESLREDWKRKDAKRNLEDAIRRARAMQPPPTPPQSGGAGSRGPTGPGKGGGSGTTPPANAPPGTPPPGNMKREAPKDLGGPIPSRQEAELWLNALESERRAQRERDQSHRDQPERSGRDW
ncbi:MAG: hypothetical protein ACM3JJ_01630 [Hyphomicrobiales bacterium]